MDRAVIAAGRNERACAYESEEVSMAGRGSRDDRVLDMAALS